MATIAKLISYTDTTAITVGNIPPNSIIENITVNVGTAFNAGGADIIDIGDSVDADEFAADIDVSSTGAATVTKTAECGAVLSTTASTPIKAVYVPAATSPTAGSAYVIVSYHQL